MATVRSKGSYLYFLVVSVLTADLAYTEFHIPDDEWTSYVNHVKNVDGYDISEPAVLLHNRYKKSSNPEFSSSIKFTAFGEDFHVDLFQSERFFHPDLKAKLIRGDNSVEEIPLNVSSECFFHGYVPTHNFSRATITMCNGSRIYGYIDHGSNGIYITPLNEDHSREYSRQKKTAQQGHLIFKRAPDGEETCPVKSPIIVREDTAIWEARFLAQSSASFVPQKYLEVLLMLDVDLVSIRGAEISTYAMALMHIVSRRYAEPSLDVSLQLFIVEVIMLSSDTSTVKGESLSVSANAGTTLNNLASWSEVTDPPNGSPGHWDNVVLVSRKNIFTSNSGNGVLGLAFTTGTCVAGLGASVNEDSGLAGALTIAHEMGHTLTLLHDGDYGCDPNYLMSAFSSAEPTTFLWTMCSSVELRRFLRGAGSDCMDNVPAGLDALPVLVLPGHMYSHNEQCTLIYGGSATGCLLDGTVDCTGLRCNAGGGCFQSRNYATAEGTPCDTDRICLAGNCVLANTVPGLVNGMWSEWNEWPCSRTCDCGVRIRERLCDDPKPEWGGDFCPGEGFEATLCNTDVSCGNTPDDHRNEQCAATDSTPLDGMLYSWTSLFGPPLDDSFRCQNPCIAQGIGGRLRNPPNVDGTDCWDFDMSEWDMLYKCVSATCQVFGCDGIPDSEVRYDVCRICDGDDTTCTRISETYSSGTLLAFNDVVTIPMGATSLLITNTDLPNGNHVAVTGLTSNRVYHRGSGSTPSERTRAWYATMVIFREEEGGQEIFFTQGPTIEDLLIEFYLSTAITNSLEYEYYVPNAAVSYMWITGDFGPCSCVTDAVETREVTCVRVAGNTQMGVDDSLCTGVKPTATRPCTTPGECFGSWFTGDFSDCSAECGGGTQIRTVDCRSNGVIVDDSFCSGEKPADSQVCNDLPCEELCCEYIHESSGTISRTLETGGQTCVVTLVADIGFTFEFNNQISSLSGSEFLSIENKADGTEPSSPIAYNVREVRYRLNGGGSFQLDYTTHRAPVTAEKCDEFIDTTVLGGTITGTLMSPRYPNRDYEANTRCWKRILAAKDGGVTLYFRRLKLQASIQRGCQWDRLEVRNLVSGKRDIFCGKMNQFTLSVSYDTVLYFKTNWRKQFMGFEVEYIVN